MLSGIAPAVSASRGTLSGDILWLATIALAFAILTGMGGGARLESERRPSTGCCRILRG